MGLLLLYLFGAMAVSFLCSLLESVLMSAQVSFITMREEDGDRNAKLFMRYKQEPDRPLAAILSLNTIANTVGAAGVGYQTNKVFGNEWFGLVSALMTLLILVFSEIVPKTIGTSQWRKLLWLARPMKGLVTLMYPLVILIELFRKKLSIDEVDTSISREEVSAMAGMAEEEGIIDKSENKFDFHHDYTQLAEPVRARFVKLINTRECHDGAKFSVKDLRVFGNPNEGKSTLVEGVKVVRNPQDAREAQLLWDPVPGADGYIIRYGIEPKKLYNSYIVYDKNYFKLHSLNVGWDYYFEVESFDSGLDYYCPRPEATFGTGGEVEMNKRTPGMRGGGYGGNDQTKRFMVKEGVDEYEFDGIDPGSWVISHSYGPVLWAGELTEADLIGKGEPGIEAKLTEMGTGTKVTGEMRMKVVRGKEAGKVVITIVHY